jgi:branched-chain amino acid transport system substrate-binding protein
MKFRLCGSIALSLTMAAALAGCGSKDESAGGGNCDNSEPVLFGQLAPLTGVSADLGAITKDGAAIGIRQVNDAGGVRGKCAKLIVKDDEGDPTKATQATRELVDREEVAVLVGSVLSSPTAAALEVTNRAPVIQLVNSSLQTASEAKDYPYSFMDEFTQGQSAQAMVDFLKRQKITKIAGLGVNNALGTYYADALPKLLEGTGIELVAPVALFDTGAVDLTPQMRKLTDKQPQALLTFVAAAPDNAAAIKARNQLSPKMPIIGTGAMANVLASGAVKAEEMDQVYAGPFPKNLTYRKGETHAIGAKADQFIEAFKKYTKTDTLKVSASQAMSAYDNVMAAAWAINGADSTDPKKLKKWFESNSFDGAGGKFVWTEKSHAGHPAEEAVFVVASTLQNGMLQLAPGEE